MIKLVAFDLDGTIGDTVPMCIKSFRKAVSPYTDHSLSDDEIIRTFGLNEEGMIKQVVDDDNWQEVLRNFYLVYKDMHEMCPNPFDEIATLIKELKIKNIPVALITGKGEKCCKITLEQFGMIDSFDWIATGNSQRNTKSTALNRLLSCYRLQPDEIVYIGDTVSDISSCEKAGICCLSAAWAVSDEAARQLEKNNRNKVFYTIRSLRDFLMEDRCDCWG